jgi:hypothetical protein
MHYVIMMINYCSVPTKNAILGTHLDVTLSTYIAKIAFFVRIGTKEVQIYSLRSKL